MRLASRAAMFVEQRAAIRLAVVLLAGLAAWPSLADAAPGQRTPAASRPTFPLRRPPAARPPSPRAPLPYHTLGLRWIGPEDYVRARDFVVQLIERFPPERYAYVAIGRSPGAIAALLLAMSDPGTPLIHELPAGGLSAGGRRLVADGALEARDAAFRVAFETHLGPAVLRSGRRILLIDMTSGGTTEAIKHMLRRYLFEAELEVEVESLSYAPAAHLLTEPGIGPGVDHLLRGEGRLFDETSGEAAAQYDRSHRIGVDRAPLADNPARPALVRWFEQAVDADDALHERLLRRGEVAPRPQAPATRAPHAARPRD